MNPQLLMVAQVGQKGREQGGPVAREVVVDNRLEGLAQLDLDDVRGPDEDLEEVVSCHLLVWVADLMGARGGRGFGDLPAFFHEVLE